MTFNFRSSWIALGGIILACLPLLSLAEDGIIFETPPASKNSDSASGRPVKSSRHCDSLVTLEVRSHMLSIKPIYESYLEKKSDLMGRLFLSVMTDASGKVLNRPEVLRTTLDSKEFVNQVIDSIVKWKFGSLANQIGTDTVRFVLSFAQAGNLVHLTVVDGKLDETEVGWMQSALKSRLSDVKNAYLNWIAFYGTVEGMAKVEVNFNAKGKADDISVAWNSGLPGALIDSLQAAMRKVNKDNFPKVGKAATATAFIRFEDLHDDPVLLMNGNLQSMPTWLQQLIFRAAQPNMNMPMMHY
jgi:hypothetical protein